MDGREIPRPPGVPGPLPTVPVEQPLVAPPVSPKTTLQELQDILDTVRAVNDIRDEIIRLGLNPALRLALETEVIPIINILQALATTTNFFAYAAFNLHNISHAKNHEIKKILDLVYDTADLSEDVLEIVRKLILVTLPKAPYK